MLLAAQLTRLNSGGDHFGIGSTVERFTHGGRHQKASPALPLTQSVGLAAAGADGQHGGVAPQLLLAGFGVRGALVRQAPQQVRPAGRGFTSAPSSALHS